MNQGHRIHKKWVAKLFLVRFCFRNEKVKKFSPVGGRGTRCVALQPYVISAYLLNHSYSATSPENVTFVLKQEHNIVAVYQIVAFYHSWCTILVRHPFSNTHKGCTQTHLSMFLGLYSTSFSMFCTSQEAYRNGPNVYINLHVVGQWNIVEPRTH